MNLLRRAAVEAAWWEGLRVGLGLGAIVGAAAALAVVAAVLVVIRLRV